MFDFKRQGVLIETPWHFYSTSQRLTLRVSELNSTPTFIRRYQEIQESVTHFVVREPERIHTEASVKLLDSQISALINQRNRILRFGSIFRKSLYPDRKFTSESYYIDCFLVLTTKDRVFLLNNKGYKNPHPENKIFILGFYYRFVLKRNVFVAQFHFSTLPRLAYRSYILLHKVVRCHEVPNIWQSCCPYQYKAGHLYQILHMCVQNLQIIKFQIKFSIISQITTAISRTILRS